MPRGIEPQPIGPVRLNSRSNLRLGLWNGAARSVLCASRSRLRIRNASAHDAASRAILSLVPRRQARKFDVAIVILAYVCVWNHDPETIHEVDARTDNGVAERAACIQCARVEYGRFAAPSALPDVSSALCICPAQVESLARIQGWRWWSVTIFRCTEKQGLRPSDIATKSVGRCPAILAHQVCAPANNYGRLPRGRRSNHPLGSAR